MQCGDHGIRNQGVAAFARMVVDSQSEKLETVGLRMVVDDHINPLLEAVAEATEEAIVNALLAAETMTGRDGITAHALDHERLMAAMRAHGRG